LENDDYGKAYHDNLEKSPVYEGAGIVRINRTDHICAGGCVYEKKEEKYETRYKVTGRSDQIQHIDLMLETYISKAQKLPNPMGPMFLTSYIDDSDEKKERVYFGLGGVGTKQYQDMFV